MEPCVAGEGTGEDKWEAVIPMINSPHSSIRYFRCIGSLCKHVSQLCDCNKWCSKVLGANWSGQLGDGTSTDRTSPVSVNGISGATQIAGGSDHTCAIVSGGSVKCWGGNGNGQLGDGTTTDRSTP
jgi:alpha-tubulin suppressor-like RCC1 family protein